MCEIFAYMIRIRKNILVLINWTYFSRVKVSKNNHHVEFFVFERIYLMNHNAIYVIFHLSFT